MRTVLASLASATLGAGMTLALSGPSTPPARSAAEILESYVADFRSDAAAETPRSFGVRVDGAEWTIEVAGTPTEEGRWSVELREGAPAEPTFVYSLDRATLEAIDAGELNALTAQGKAFPDDPAPLEVLWMEGAGPRDINVFSFHFWTRGFPERIPFRRGLSRVVHGVDMVVFHYQPGFRSAWASIGERQRASNGPGQPIVAPFPTLVIPVSGQASGEVAGKRVEAPAGEAVFIPPMTPHEWWNEGDEPAEAVLVFFGEGA